MWLEVSVHLDTSNKLISQTLGQEGVGHAGLGIKLYFSNSAHCDSSACFFSMGLGFRVEQMHSANMQDLRALHLCGNVACPAVSSRGP